MSLSNEQLRHVIGEETRAGVGWTATQLRDLVPMIQAIVGQKVMDGQDPESLLSLIDQGNCLTDAADILDRLCDYLGSLES